MPILTRCYHLCRLGLLVAIIGLTGACAATTPPPEPTPTAINDPDNPPLPSPALGPQEVVRIQVEALQNNDIPAPDSGIRTAFIFASPDNKRNTGPIERFIPLVKNPQYRALLNARQIRIGRAQIDGRQAAVEVSLIAIDGSPARYLFLLSQQQEFPLANCWMTDSVIPLDPSLGADET